MDRYKKMLHTAAASALVLALSTGTAFAALGTATVTEGPLRMREAASTDSEVLLKASKGASVEVLEDAGDGWYQVSYKGTTGYMSADYLSLAPAPRELTAQAAPISEAPVEADLPEDAGEQPLPPAVEELCALISVSSVLNVRSGPGTDYDKVGSLHCGDIVTVLSQEGDWSQVSFGSVTGYVSNEYLTFGAREELAAMASAAGAQIVEIAKQYLGVPYRYGGASPSGFDCSGFVYYVYKQAGRSVPRTGSAMWSSYSRVDREDLQPGDVVCFTRTTGSSHYITHVGLYVGNGTFIHSSSPSSGGVIYTSLSENYYATRYVGAVRLL